MGIDPGMKSGLVVLEHPAPRCKVPLLVETKEIEVPKGLGDMESGRRLAAQAVAVAVRLGIRFAVIEGYGFASARLVTSVTIGTLYRDRLWKNGIEFIEVAPTRLKKFATGKGKAKKDEVRLEIYKRWGFENPSNNVVDAYGLACIGLAVRGNLPGLIKPQEEVVLALKAKEGSTA
jgi:crossover junction endodeoxyribonuclease RuvC